MSTIPSSKTERLDLLQRHIQILINQYGSILHSSSPYSSSTVNSNMDEAKLRSATLAITTSVKFLLDVIHDLRTDTLLILNNKNNINNNNNGIPHTSTTRNTSTSTTNLSIMTNHSEEHAMNDI